MRKHLEEKGICRNAGFRPTVNNQVSFLYGGNDQNQISFRPSDKIISRVGKGTFARQRKRKKSK